MRDFTQHTGLATTQSYVHRIENESVTVSMQEAMEH